MDSLNAVYLEMLQKWIKSLSGVLYFPPGRDDIACCGYGDHGHWSQQTNTTTFAALAVLAADPELNETAIRMAREQLRDYALRLLRFSLRTHLAGTEKALDGESWGLTWISPLCIERMMHGVEALDEYLTPDDREALKKMLLAESDWHLDSYEVVAEIDGTKGKNRPESNIWNGCVLFRTAMMYPDAPRRNEYLEKANSFLLNGISIPADADDMTLIDGKPLKEWHIGPNFTEHYGLHHHGYLNVGYMVICMSNIAMLHFSCKSKGITVPEALYHHVPELWRLIKLCTFSDGRLWRIGGDTRVRYCYCQDYAIPMWLLMKDKYGEDTRELEEGWLKQVAMEQDGNADGSFLGSRLAEFKDKSPLYFQRLEGDRAVTLSMGAYWRRKYNDFAAAGPLVSAPVCGGWYDLFHGAMLEKGPRRAASWVWQAAQRPSGMCLPSAASSLAEWKWNMTGEIAGLGLINYAGVAEYRDTKFPGGFKTAGRLEWHSDSHLAEGQANEITAKEDIAVFALPDDATMVVFQRAKTVNRIILKSVKGLFYNVPNDIFNGCTRNYRFDGGTASIEGVNKQQENVTVSGRDITIEDQVSISGIYGIAGLTLHRPGSRQVEVFGNSYGRAGRNLYCDEICHPCITGNREYPAHALLFDQAFAVGIGESTIEAEPLATGNDEIKAVKIKGADGVFYILAVNFAASAVLCSNPVIGAKELSPLETVLITL
jgi:hypothetical protein